MRFVHYILIVGSLMGLTFFVVLHLVNTHLLTVNKVWVSYEIDVKKQDTLEVFYNNGKGFVANNKVILPVSPTNYKKVLFPSIDAKGIQEVRLDFGQFNESYRIKNVKIYSVHDTIDIMQNTNLLKTNCLSIQKVTNQAYEIQVDCMDPHIVFKGDLKKLKADSYTQKDKQIIAIVTGIYLLIVIALLRLKIGYTFIRKHRFSDVLFVSLFLFFISFHWYAIISGFMGNDFTLERRLPASFPEKGDTAYIAGVENWFNDNLEMRQSLIRTKSQLSYFIWNKSAMPQKVIVGKNMELFPSSEFLLEDFKGEMILTKEQLLSIQRIVHERIRYLEKLKGDYYLIMPANKQTIYPSDMPLKYAKKQRPEKTMMSQLVDFLATDTLIQAHFFDTRPTLLKAAKESDKRIYCKNDLHWNGYGAYYAYYDLLLKLSIKHPSLKPISLDRFNVKRKLDKEGDLARMLLLHNQAYRELFEFTTKDAPAYRMRTIYGQHLFPIYKTNSEASTLPKAIVFRDSFCQDMIQFLSLHFSEATYVWDQEFNDVLLREEKPDIVIQEITEMFIYDLLRINTKEVSNEK